MDEPNHISHQVLNDLKILFNFEIDSLEPGRNPPLRPSAVKQSPAAYSP